MWRRAVTLRHMSYLFRLLFTDFTLSLAAFRFLVLPHQQDAGYASSDHTMRTCVRVGPSLVICLSSCDVRYVDDLYLV